MPVSLTWPSRFPDPPWNREPRFGAQTAHDLVNTLVTPLANQFCNLLRRRSQPGAFQQMPRIGNRHHLFKMRIRELPDNDIC